MIALKNPRRARMTIAIVVAVIAGCASPLTVAEPRDGGEAPATGAFPDAGPLETGTGVDSGTLADPTDGSPSD